MSEMGDARMSNYLGRTKRIIEDHGWAVQAVFPLTEDDEWLIYSVGLAARGLPEFAVVGLPQDIGHSVINRIAEWAIQNGVPPLGEEWGTEEFDVSIPLFLIPRSDLEVNVARFFEPEAAVVQILWPDQNGRWPWDESADFQCRRQMGPGIPE
jgi:hypothetical protein